MKLRLNLFHILILLSINIGQSSNSIQKTCNDQETCTKCINAHVDCVWCKDKNFNEAHSRCDLKNKFHSCKNFEEPGSEIHIKTNKELNQPGAETENIVQITPQEVTVKLRPGFPKNITVKFRQAKDYPVDLYFIMDVSSTMKQHKDKLVQLGDLLAETMTSITKNFRLGFGSFVDKPALPYAIIVPEILQKPCSGCVSPHGFINHMALSDKTKQFKVKVNETQLSSNMDNPEGGFDAIVQAAVCEKEIAWREASRKLIVFSTDSGYHIAGDGKLAGIVMPNDEKCHLDKNGNYTASLEYDYPSVSQLSQILKGKKIHLIFAVTDTQVELYSNLTKRLESSGVVKLDKDSTNIVGLIKDMYNNITSRVDLRDNAGDGIKVSYSSKCLSKKGPLQNTKICENLQIGSEVEFEVTIDVGHCPENRNEWNKTFEIYTVGLDESVIVNLEMICECGCEKSGIQEDSISECSQGNGTLQCGQCKCNPGRYGRQCECDDIYRLVKNEDNDGCKKPNSSIICSGFGDCICGMCVCSITGKREKPFSGKYCECDDDSCPMTEFGLCNGKGKCKCGECSCDKDWEGDACDCVQNTDNCKAPESNIICSKNGNCVCGRCNCKETDQGRYSGQYCEECPSCRGQCDLLCPCVVCRDQFKGNERDICKNFTCTKNVILKDKLDDVKANERICVQTDEDGCKLTYKYGTKLGEYYIISETTKKCPQPLNLTLIITTVITGVLIIGLSLLLTWKIITTVHDRREFAKFENESKSAKWDQSENPIYKPSTCMYQNPTYNQ